MPNAIDTNTFYMIYRGMHNRLFDVLMPLVSALGTGEAVFIITLIIFVLRKKKDKGRLILCLLAGLALTFYIVSFIKMSVARPRPPMALPDVSALVSEKSFSFPSNHAAQAFMGATIISAFLYRWRFALFAIAGLIAFSRIYLGVHYLSDVVAGAIIGTLIGLAVLTISRTPGHEERS